MVPVLLAAEVSCIIDEVSGAVFSLHPSEEEAGLFVRDLLHLHASASGSVQETALTALQIVALRLDIISPKALLIEKRSIKKLLDKLGETELKKKEILLFFLNILNKYGKSIVKGQTDNDSMKHKVPFPSGNSVEINSRVKYKPEEAEVGISSRPVPPDEFKCPLSLRLMYDPVVIASGQTFERMWIQKWLEEGHDTCPVTKMRLAHLLLTPNDNIKDLITKWCAAHEVTISDPSLESASWESSSTSIASLTSSIKELSLPVDFSNLSYGFVDSTHVLDYSNGNITNQMSVHTDNNASTLHGGLNEHKMNIEFLLELNSLPWESQCNLVENIVSVSEPSDQIFNLMSPEDVVPTLSSFLKDAYDYQDVKAMTNGCIVLLAFLEKSRGMSYLTEDTVLLLASLLDTEVNEEALAILEELSSRDSSAHKIASSGVLVHLIELLDSRTREIQERAIRIFCNFSERSEIDSYVAPSKLIPKLVPFLGQSSMTTYCLSILKNICHKEEARVLITETGGCITTIIKLLEIDSQKDQEHAVAILLSLCSQRQQICRMVLDEGVIPSLTYISINGNSKGKVMSLELLRILRQEVNDIAGCSEPEYDVSRDSRNETKTRRSSSKASGFFGKMSLFSKPKSFAAKVGK